MREQQPEVVPTNFASAEVSELIDQWNAEILRADSTFNPEGGSLVDSIEFRPPAGAFLVVRDGAQAIGCGGVRRLDGDTAEVKRLYVTPKARGRGAGRLLLDALAAEAKALGYGRLRLDTDGGDPAALGLFRSAGFEEVQPYNANEHARLWFQRDLN